LIVIIIFMLILPILTSMVMAHTKQYTPANWTVQSIGMAGRNPLHNAPQSEHMASASRDICNLRRYVVALIVRLLADGAFGTGRRVLGRGLDGAWTNVRAGRSCEATPALIDRFDVVRHDFLDIKRFSWL
jgi:hypothetical protein